MASKVVFFVALASLYLVESALLSPDEHLCFCGSSNKKEVADTKKYLVGLFHASSSRNNFKDHGILKKCSECPGYKAILDTDITPEEDYVEYGADEESSEDNSNDRRLLMW